MALDRRQQREEQSKWTKIASLQKVTSRAVAVEWDNLPSQQRQSYLTQMQAMLSCRTSNAGIECKIELK